MILLLQSVMPGLANKEILEQSSCLVFHEGRVYTFNDEVACSRDSFIPMEGAVKATELVALLNKLTEDEIEVGLSDSYFRVKVGRKRSKIRMEAEVLLPVDQIEVPESWRPLPESFNDAVQLVCPCAATDASEWDLTNVHLTPAFMEATDRNHLARYYLDTGMKKEILVQADSLKKILGLDMSEVSETRNWIHFRNSAGLVMSLRRHLHDYPDLEILVDMEGTEKINLPGGLSEMVEKAVIFTENNANGNRVQVRINSTRMVVCGEGPAGSYEEMKEVSYAGEKISFFIAPELLVKLSEKGNQCRISEGRLCIDMGAFKYISCTESENKEEAVKE